MDFTELQKLARKVSNKLARFSVTWDHDGCYVVRCMIGKRIIARLFGEPEHAALYLETYGNATSPIFQGAYIVADHLSAFVEPPSEEKDRYKWMRNFKEHWKYPCYTFTGVNAKCSLQNPSHMHPKAFLAGVHTAALLATVATRKETE